MLELTNKNFESEVLKSNIPVIVDFWASWCGPCQRLAPEFEKASKEFKDKVKFAKLSTEEDPDLARDHGVTSIPCMIIFKDGKEKDRIIGFKVFDDLVDEINEKLEGSRDEHF